MALITVYHVPGSRSTRVVWVLEEMGLAYEVQAVRISPEAGERHRKINPTGALPAIEDDGTVIFESMAICEYLANRHGPTPLLVKPDAADYGPYVQFLHYGEATLAGLGGTILAHTRFLPEEMRVPQVAAMAADRLIQRFSPVVTALESRDYLAAGRVTLADVSVGYAVSLALFAGLGDRLDPSLVAYWERLAARPALATALAPIG